MEEVVTPQAVQAVVRSSSTHHRDSRLDFWRGLCIVDMILVHLVHQGLVVGSIASAIIGDYTRFAAGGFVFVSGLCVGAIHLRRARDPSRRRAVYTGMFRRAGFILLVHYLATLTALLLCPLKGERLDLAQTFIDTLLLREGYDLLPFYVCMVALCPLLLELLRRGFWWVAAGASAAAFALGCYNPWLAGFPLQHDFFPLLWQLLFVAGLFSGSQLAKYDQLNRQTKTRILIATTIASIGLTLAARLEAAGVVLPAHLTFSKVPLSLGEAMRYLSIILSLLLSTDLIWSKIDGSTISRFVNRMGRRSLGMAVIHVWVVMAALNLAGWYPQSLLFAFALMAATVGAMGLIAQTLDRLSQSWKNLNASWPRFEYAAVPALTALVILTLGIANPPDPAQSILQAAPIQLASARSPSLVGSRSRFSPQPVRATRYPAGRGRPTPPTPRAAS